MITKKNSTKEDLRKDSLYVRSLIEASLDPLVTISKDGKITDVNKATEDITGTLRENLIGTDFSNYFVETEEAKRGYKEVLFNGFIRDYPLTIKNKNGKITSVLYNATVYRNENDEIEGVFAMARDVTEMKKIEEKLKEKIIDIEKANEMMINREVKMASLKEKINQLEDEIKRLKS